MTDQYLYLYLFFNYFSYILQPLLFAIYLVLYPSVNLYLVMGLDFALITIHTILSYKLYSAAKELVDKPVITLFPSPFHI